MSVTCTYNTRTDIAVIGGIAEWMKQEGHFPNGVYNIFTIASTSHQLVISILFASAARQVIRISHKPNEFVLVRILSRSQQSVCDSVNSQFEPWHICSKTTSNKTDVGPNVFPHRPTVGSNVMKFVFKMVFCCQQNS